MAAFCGVDVGTQGVRAVVLDADGVELGAGARSFADGPVGDGRHEQDPRLWWDAMTAAVREAVSAAAPVEVAALALDATSGTVLVEGSDGEPLGPALMYDDARARDQALTAQRRGEQLWSALGYRMQGSWALPKVMWLLANDHVPSGARVVHQSDHLLRRLVAHPVPTDTSNALKTGADLRHVSWPDDVFGELGIAEGVLPELVLPGTDVGTVSPEAAAATGLPTSCRVRTGMTDGCASQLASGALRSGSWSSTLGTTLVLKGSTESLVHDPSGAVYSHRHPDGGWLPGGASSCGAGVFRTLLPGRDLTALTAQVGRVSDHEAITYPLVGSGERFPFVAPDARGFTIPADAHLDDRNAFVAACLGLAYVEKLAYDVLGRLGADTSGSVALTGGAAANPWLNQLRADVLGRRATVPATTGAAAGMAVLAAAEPGELAATAERMVRMASEVEPDTERGDELRTGYDRLVEAFVERGWLDVDLVAPHAVAGETR